MNDPPKRRRFQFRLRTLLILVALLAVPCAYVGWQAKIVQERRQFLDEIRSEGGFASDQLHGPSPTPSWIRRVLGDEYAVWLVVNRSIDAQRLSQIKRLFPEAIVVRKNGDAQEIVSWPDDSH
jgi:hypothetical protein